MAKDPKPETPEKASDQFNLALKQALMRGLDEKTGAEGARARVISDKVPGVPIWRRGVGGLVSVVSQRDVTNVCDELALLLECGMPLVTALYTTSQRVENFALAKAIRDIGSRVEEGVTFSNAIAEKERLFPTLVVNMIRAGERSGNLVEALYRVAEHGEHLTAARRKAAATLVYPVFLIIMTICVVAFVFSWVLGQFGPVFKDMQLELPRSMQTLIAAGELFRTASFWLKLFGIIGGVFVLYIVAMRFRFFRRMRDGFFLAIPGLRRFIRERLLARFSRIFSIMIESGVSLDESLQAAYETNTNEVMKDTIEAVRQEVREGGRITPPLERARVFPPLAVDMIAVGEEAGALGRVLERIADVYEEKVETDMAIMGKFVQPFIVITIALIILFVIIGFLSTYLSLLGQLPIQRP